MTAPEFVEDDTRREPSALRHLQDVQQALEKTRIGMGNRISAWHRNNPDTELPKSLEMMIDLHDKLLEIEERSETLIGDELLEYPIWNEWLRHVKGVGPAYGGQLLSYLLPPLPTKGPSSWYKACGLYPQERPDGQYRLPRPRKGEGKVTYHPYMRRNLYNLATSFVRSGGYYREMYDRSKERLVALHEGDTNWPKGRIDSVARWVTIKLFLAHLWEKWCEVEGIHNRGPYGLTTLEDGTQVIRYQLDDGSYTEHAYYPAPDVPAKGKI